MNSMASFVHDCYHVAQGGGCIHENEGHSRFGQGRLVTPGSFAFAIGQIEQTQSFHQPKTLGQIRIELIKNLKARYPELPTLVLSMHDESLYAERVLRAGGRGYIMKQEGGKKLMEAIRHVLGGGTYVSPKISARILDSFSGRSTKGSSPVERLTDREFEVFQLIGRGFNTRRIAEDLHLGIKTVESYRARIKEKLKLDGGTELLQHAIQWVHNLKT